MGLEGRLENLKAFCSVLDKMVPEYDFNTARLALVLRRSMTDGRMSITSFDYGQRQKKISSSMKSTEDVTFFSFKVATK